jgi:hypothetical protein
VSEFGVVAQQRLVVGAHLPDRLRPVGGHGNDAGRRVIGVGPELPLQAGFQRALPFDVELGPGDAVFAPRPDVEQRREFAVQLVRGPVRRHIAAVAPDGADLLPAHRLPGQLAVLDVLLGEQHLAGRRDHLRRQGRRLSVDLASHQPQDGE